MPELDRVREDGRSGDLVNEMEASIVLGRVSDVIAGVATEVPSGSYGGLVVDDDSATKGADGSGVVIEGAVEVFPS